ncbi:MAG: hypothetical protein ACW97V_14470, partial [Promethearchaeota archaeon]
QALTGVDYRIELKQFKFSPRMNTENFTTFFITGSAWGQVIQQISDNKVSSSLSVSHGSLEIHSILLEALGGCKPVKCNVLLKETQDGENKPLEAVFSVNNSGAEIVLTEALVLKEGHKLIIELN